MATGRTFREVTGYVSLGDSGGNCEEIISHSADNQRSLRPGKKEREQKEKKERRGGQNPETVS